MSCAMAFREKVKGRVPCWEAIVSRQVLSADDGRCERGEASEFGFFCLLGRLVEDRRFVMCEMLEKI